MRFTTGNAKLSDRRGLRIFSLPAGHTCPGAKDCATFAEPDTGKIHDGPEQEFRCYAATSEARSTQLRILAWRNLVLLKNAGTREAMADLIGRSLDPAAEIVRLHQGGDFFSEAYFGAWIDVARVRPDVLFYGYTKSLHHVGKLKDEIPGNLVLSASRGGKFDDMIEPLGMRECVVVRSPEEADELGLPVDHDDGCAMDPEVKRFALLIHGTQPAGSQAAKDLMALRRRGIGGYSRKEGGRGKKDYIGQALEALADR